MNIFIKAAIYGLPGLIIVILVILAYHDFFKTPKIEEKEVGPFTIAVKRYIGSYYKVGPTMNEVDKLLRDIGLKPTRGVGLYYDDPAKKDQNKLRSDVGDMIGRVDEKTLEKIKEKLTVKEIEKQRAVVVTFPIKSPLSYMIGPMKVYPAITKYFKEKGYPEYSESKGYGMEIYNIPNKVTLYIIPLAK